MPEEEITQTPQPTESKPANWPKIILAAVLGLGLLAGSASAGYWYGTESAKLKSQISKPQLKTQSEQETNPTPTPTPPQVKEEIDEATGWKIYTDSAAGFTLKYPPNLARGEPQKDDALALAIYSRWVDGLDFPNGYDRETALKDRQALSEGKFGEPIDWPLEASKKVVKIDGKYAKDFLVLIRFHTEDRTFERKLIFYNNGYQVEVVLHGVTNDIISSMPQYFKTQKTDYGEEWSFWDLDKIDNFYQTLVEGNGSSAAQEWYDTFDQILPTFKFLE